jgi:hypothetical protein
MKCFTKTLFIVLMFSLQALGKEKPQSLRELEAGLAAADKLFSKVPELRYIYFNKVAGQVLAEAAASFEGIIDTCIAEFGKRGKDYLSKVNRLKVVKKAIKEFLLILNKYPKLTEYESDLELVEELILNCEIEKAVEKTRECMIKYPEKM